MLEVLPQLFFNGLIAGSIYALLALGLALIYGVLRFVNFAHGEFAMIGAYFFFTFHTLFAWPIIPSFLLGIGSLVLVGLIFEKLIFLPVRDAPTLIPLIISIGAGIFLKNLTLLAYGSNVRALGASVPSHELFDGKIIFTNVHIAVLVAAILLMMLLFIFLKKTKIGKAIRAVSDNREIAAIFGIPINKIITAIFMIAMGLAAVAGILVGFDQNLQPNMGTFLSVKAFAAVILGGIGSIPGALLGGYFIGFAENILIGIPFGEFYIPSGLKDAIAFLAIVMVLYLKPTGLLGVPQSETIRK